MALAGMTAGGTVVQTIASYIGGITAHNDARNAAYENDAQKIQALNQQNVQLSQQESQNVETNAIRGAQAYGHIAASASGLSLATTNPLMSADIGAINRDTSVFQQNAQGSRYQLQQERFQAALDRKSAIDAVPKPGISSLFMGMGKAAIQGATTYAAAGGSLKDLPGQLGFGKGAA